MNLNYTYIPALENVNNMVQRIFAAKGGVKYFHKTCSGYVVTSTVANKQPRDNSPMGTEPRFLSPFFEEEMLYVKTLDSA
jgi:hypothetical protein